MAYKCICITKALYTRYFAVAPERRTVKARCMPISEGQITIRLPQDLLDRLDDLIDPVSELPEYRALRITRSVVLRLALDSGLEALEARLATTKSKARGRKRRRS